MRVPPRGPSPLPAIGPTAPTQTQPTNLPDSFATSGPSVSPPFLAKPTAGGRSVLTLRASLGADELINDQRTKLNLARATAAAAMNAPGAKAKEIVAASKQLTQAFDVLVQAFDRRIRLELGAPPTDPATQRPATYCLFGAGSYGRNEMSLYSDLDYGLLISSSSPKVREYFDRYSARMAELLLRIDGPSGIHACNELSPSGCFGQAMIDTPVGMANRLGALTEDMPRRSLRDQAFIQSALTSARSVVESGGLFAEFTAAKDTTLGPASPEIDPRGARTALLARALAGLRDPFGLPKESEHWFDVPAGGLDPAPERAQKRPAFKPIPADQAISEGRINVKHDLLRTLQIPLQALSVLYGCASANGDDVLRELTERKLINPDFASKLRETLAACLRLRLTNDSRVGRSESLLSPVTPEDKRAIRRMLPLLYRLKQSMEQLETIEPNRFSLSGSSARA